MMSSAKAKKLRVMVVDDEEPARLIAREMLESDPGIEIVGEATNGFEAVALAAELQPDIVILDIQMPKLSGFETLELLDRRLAIVFATAYDEYAVRAFEVNAVDYLLKPYSAERFADALERAKKRVGQERAVSASALAAAARSEGKFIKRLAVRDGTRVDIIPVDQLDYAKGQADYIELCSHGRSFLKQQTLQSLVDALDPAQFVRVHRSYLVNIARLTRIEPWGAESKVAVLENGERIPISRTGYARLKAAIDRCG
jgi:two-component system LytT family response regulator